MIAPFSTTLLMASFFLIICASPSHSQEAVGSAQITGGPNRETVDAEAFSYHPPSGGELTAESGQTSGSLPTSTNYNAPPVFPALLYLDNVCGMAPDENFQTMTPQFDENISGCILGYESPQAPPGNGGPGGGSGNPGPSPGRIIDRVIELVAAPELELAPAEVGLTGLATYVWIDAPEDVLVTAVAGGTSVQARAFPAQYLWKWGDGDDTLTYHSGRRWTKSRPGTIEHVYETRGRYDLSVEVVWEAQWRIGGGPWQPLGFFSLADTIDYPVRQIQARLTRTST